MRRGIIMLMALMGALLLGVSGAWAATATLTWINGTGQTGNRVERQTGTGAFVVLTSVAGTATTYSDVTVVDGTTYCFRVVSFNSSGDGPASNSACGSRVAVPTGATALTLSWQ